MRLILLFALIIKVCFPQQISPEILARTEPDFPEEARKAGVDGTVVVELVVDPDGNPTNLRIKKPIGFGFDEAALKAVALWKFKPGVTDGVPLASDTTVEVNFRIPETHVLMHIERFSCEAPQGTPHLQVLKVEQPAPPRDPYESFSASVSLDVDERGTPANFRVTKLSDPSREEDVKRALLAWRFQPTDPPAFARCRLSFMAGPEIESYRGIGISLPQLVSKVKPKYPREARRARVEGTVVLFVIVDANGKPQALKVLKPLGSGLDEAAIESVRQWVFQPGRKDGKAVAVQATVQVNFRLLDK
ncbi:MAG TPA: energy transducer TonB [Bryobacteraceae bacterium]|nr:energy transducer TonB [Bryobacteraceae bacterium]